MSVNNAHSDLGKVCISRVRKYGIALQQSLMLFSKKALRWGYSSELRRLSVLLHEADAQLFRKMINNKDHCTHQLLPPEKLYP